MDLKRKKKKKEGNKKREGGKRKEYCGENQNHQDTIPEIQTPCQVPEQENLCDRITNPARFGQQLHVSKSADIHSYKPHLSLWKQELFSSAIYDLRGKFAQTSC